MNKTNLSLILVSILMLLVAEGATPNAFQYSGVLKDTGGNRLYGLNNISYRIYDAYSGGNLLFERNESVNVSYGVFYMTVYPTINEVYYRNPLFVRLKVNTDTESISSNVSNTFYAKVADYAMSANISGENITSGTVADARIASTITRDSEVPSLETDAGHDDCSEITGCVSGAATTDSIYTLLSTYLNLTGLYVQLSTYLNASDQSFNETLIIANVNTSANIKALGFNKTSELDNIYYAITNPSTFISDGNTGWDNTYGLLTNASMNKSVNCLNIYGGSDGDFCADATGVGGGGNSTDQIRTAINNSGIYNLSINASNVQSEYWINDGTKLGNSSAEIQAAELDAAHDSCSEISECVVGAITSYIDTDTNTTKVQVTGTTTKTFNLEQPGQANLTATWTDIDTDTNTFNSSGQMIFAVNNTVLNGSLFRSINCSEIIFAGGVQGSAGICDGVDASSAGGGNSTYEMVNAINITVGLYNITVNNSNAWDSFGDINATAFQLEGSNLGIKMGLWEGIFYKSSNPSNYITNVSMNKTVRCLDIVGTPDTDFCTDAGGAEVDPSVGLTTSANVCLANGTGVNCNATVQACSGTDKMVYSNGVFTCATDQTGAGAGWSFFAFNRTTANISQSSNSVYTTLFIMPLSTSNIDFIECILYTWANAATVGVQFNFTITGSSTNRGNVEYHSTATAKSLLDNSAFTTWQFLPTASQGTLISPYRFYIESTRTGAGSLTLGVKSETATATNVVVGSNCKAINRV